MSEQEPHVCYSCLEFEDGSAEAMPLHVGTMEECQKTRDIIPAIAYSGDKEVRRSFIGVATHKSWCEAWAAVVVTQALDDQKVGG